MAENGMKVVESLNEVQWREFLESHPGGNVFLTPEMYAVYENTKRCEPIFLAVKNESDEVLALLLADLDWDYPKPFGYLTARSIMRSEPLCEESERGLIALDMLLRKYDEVASKKSLYSQIRNLDDPSFIAGVVKSQGYSYEEHLNYLIDLNRSIDDTWKDLSKGRRKGIKRARKYGLLVEDVKKIEQLKESYEVLLETHRRVKIPFWHISYLENIWRIMCPKGMAKYIIVREGEECIATRVALAYKGVVYDRVAGSKKKSFEKYADELAVWQIIEWASDQGFKIFDFGGAGSPNVVYGPREFKRRFGGKLINPGRFEKVYSPLGLSFGKKMYELYRRVG